MDLVPAFPSTSILSQRHNSPLANHNLLRPSSSKWANIWHNFQARAPLAGTHSRFCNFIFQTFFSWQHKNKVSFFQKNGLEIADLSICKGESHHSWIYWGKKVVWGSWQAADFFAHLKTGSLIECRRQRRPSRCERTNSSWHAHIKTSNEDNAAKNTTLLKWRS